MLSYLLLFFISLALLSAVEAAAKISLPKILVVGASGRVGGSALLSIHKNLGENVLLTAGGRNEKNWDKYIKLKKYDKELFNFQQLNIDDETKLPEIISKYDLIINTAGPFQGLQTPKLLDICLKEGKDYLDVCDDVKISRVARSKERQDIAKKTGACAIISTGIWPGCSSLLAKKLVNQAGGSKKVEKVVFSFFTAGSGGAGPTILSATFLILGEDVLTYVNGTEVFKKSATDSRFVDFEGGIGLREVARLNLIECESCFQMDIPNVETFFGTAPPIWNKLFVLMANLIPQKVLKDRVLMDSFAKFSLPMVRLVDNLVGSKNGIRVDVISKDGSVLTGILNHKDLEQCVGDAIAEFAIQLLNNRKKNKKGKFISSGIYFPEELSSSIFSDQILENISKSAIQYSIKKQ